MNTFKKISILGLLATGLVFGQANTLYSTTTSQALSATQNVIYVASVSNMVTASPLTAVAATQLYVIDPGSRVGEVMSVISINTTAKAVTVRRLGPQSGYSGSTGQGTGVAHLSGATVLYGDPSWFYSTNPTGTCTTAQTYAAPWLNVATGEQWLCSTITTTWVAGFQNLAAPAQVTAAVASVAGATAVNGPLQHITGTNAITSFTMANGWVDSGFCVIPDGAFTTTATNNILKASTAVASRTLCFTYDYTNSGFVPSY